MAPDARGESLRIRMSELEKTMLSELAEAEQLTASEWLRLVIRREHAARFGTKTKKKPR